MEKKSVSGRSLSAAKADVIYGLVLGVLASVMMVHTFSSRYEVAHLFGDVSTMFAPRLLLGVMIALSVALVFKGLRNRGGDVLASVNIPRVALTFLAATATTAGVWFIGFFIAMPIGIFLTGLALGYPGKLVLAGTSVAGTIIVWLTLGVFANVALPAGVLF